MLHLAQRKLMSIIYEYLTASNMLAIAYLVLIEGILSVDNALALAALVKSRLPNIEERKKALHYGIIGAYVFRVVVIFAGVWLMKHLWVKWAAAAYLIYLGISELFFKKEQNDGEVSGIQVGFLSPLWSTIIAVEMMDIMFSIDSIAVALSISNIAWVLIAGAMLGILTMRFAAQLFIKLIEKFPILEKTAFLLVLIAGLKIVAELSGYHINEILFMCIMFSVIGLSIAIDHFLDDNVRES